MFVSRSPDFKNTHNIFIIISTYEFIYLLIQLCIDNFCDYGFQTLEANKKQTNQPIELKFGRFM